MSLSPDAQTTADTLWQRLIEHQPAVAAALAMQVRQPPDGVSCWDVSPVLTAWAASRPGCSASSEQLPVKGTDMTLSTPPPRRCQGVLQQLPCGVGQARGLEDLVDRLADGLARDGPPLTTTGPLEEQRSWRKPDLFQAVVEGDQGDGAVGFTDPADDRAEDVGEFRADDQESFLVGLGRGDLQKRDELAGRGEGVLGDAV